MVRERYNIVVGHSMVRYDIILDPYFNRIMSDFLKNQHCTAHNGTKSRHDTIRYESMTESTTQHEIKIPHDTK
jgi:hypothetical protein